MDDLLAKYLLREATSAEERIVELWLTNDPDHLKYFEQLKLTWTLSKNLLTTATADENKAWQQFQKLIRKPGLKISVFRRYKWVSIAALFIVVVGAGLLYLLSSEKSPIQNQIVRTGNGVLRNTLSDGSVVTLNKNSVLRYPEKFNGKTRNASLKGEAFFLISPDKKRPFIIEANGVMVKVIGTSFNVHTTDTTIEVIVETGVVQVGKNNKTIELRPGERLITNARDSVLIKEQERDQLYKYYRSNEFVCDNTPLWKLVEVLNEAYHVNIVIEQKHLRNLPLTATFSNESLDHILEVISITFNITVSRSNDKISLR